MVPAVVLIFNRQLTLNSVLKITTKTLTTCTSWDHENDVCPKVTKMGSRISHRIDFNGVEVLRGQQHKPSKNWPKYPSSAHPGWKGRTSSNLVPSNLFPNITLPREEPNFGLWNKTFNENDPKGQSVCHKGGKRLLYILLDHFLYSEKFWSNLYPSLPDYFIWWCKRK